MLLIDIKLENCTLSSAMFDSVTITNDDWLNWNSRTIHITAFGGYSNFPGFICSDIFLYFIKNDPKEDHAHASFIRSIY